MEDRFSCTWEGSEPHTTRGQQSPGEGFESDFSHSPIRAGHMLHIIKKWEVALWELRPDHIPCAECCIQPECLHVFPLVNIMKCLQVIISGVILLLTGKREGELGVLQTLELSGVGGGILWSLLIMGYNQHNYSQYNTATVSREPGWCCSYKELAEPVLILKMMAK